MYILSKELGEGYFDILRMPFWVARKRLKQIEDDYKRQKEETEKIKAKGVKGR